MATRTSAELKKAFKRFVELVKPIEDVRHVIAWGEGEPEISTYVTRLDNEVSFLVHRAEGQIMDEFADLPVDFHVWYLEGRSLDTFVRSLPLLHYSRDS